MWGARRFRGLTLAELGKHFGGMDYAAVSVAFKRFEAISQTDPALRRRQAALGKVLSVETCPLFPLEVGRFALVVPPLNT